MSERDFRTRPLRVLIVDDDASFAESLRMFLNDDDRMTVRSIATDLRTALAAVQSIPFDLALVDVRFVEGDGFAVVSALTELDPDLIALMISGLDVEVYHEAALKAGARGVMTKSDIVRRGRGSVISAYINATQAGQQTPHV